MEKISYLKTEGELDIKPRFYRKWKHWKQGSVDTGHRTPCERNINIKLDINLTVSGLKVLGIDC